MLTIKDFKKKFNGHNKSYSSVMLIGRCLTIQDVVNTLNELTPEFIDENSTIGSGYGRASKEAGYDVVGFEICREMPDIVFPLTAKLKCTGYADVNWDETYFVAAKNGENYDGFSANFAEGCPEYREDDCWDAFIDIMDDETNEVFSTGAGAVNDEQMLYFKDIVRKH